jgi:carboxypeptidase Q
MRHLRVILLGILAAAGSTTCRAQTVPADPLAKDRVVLDRLLDEGLHRGEAYDMLRILTTQAGKRLSGSTGAEKAVALTKSMMEARDFDNVRLEPVTVPHWERGHRERGAIVLPGGGTIAAAVCALGGSIATPVRGITAEVIEVRSFDALAALGTRAAGKIIFFNRPMDPGKLQTFEAYGGAVDQRSQGAIHAAKAGGVASLVRSMTLAHDRVPHTGGMGYEEGVTKVPGAAISTIDADTLSALLARGARVRFHLELSCRTLPDAPSANVLGEIRGSLHPDEVVVIGGHLDAWDKGTGAHDDGSGCVQAIEAVRLLRRLGIRPARTIRAVMFMNEENGLRGGKAYAVDSARSRETHIALIESDRGGFAPRGFTGDSTGLPALLRWKPLFDVIDAGRIVPGGGGADISPLAARGVPSFGLDPENHRYFDYHHSDNDTIDKLNQRELDYGAIASALLCYLIAEHGL